MNLLTLRLGAPLWWVPLQPAPAATASAATPPAASAWTPPNLDREGSEAVFIWTREQLVDDSDEGPQLRRPLAPPLRSGVSAEDGASTPEAATLVLPAGSYLFCQGRLDQADYAERTLEWFFREIWWTRSAYRGPVYLRLIREDGKTAVQALMEEAP